jgi:hypothetical protein
VIDRLVDAEASVDRCCLILGVTRQGIYGLPGPVRVKRMCRVSTADDLGNRKFHRVALNELRVNDIAQLRTGETPVSATRYVTRFGDESTVWVPVRMRIPG